MWIFVEVVSSFLDKAYLEDLYLKTNKRDPKL